MMRNPGNDGRYVRPKKPKESELQYDIPSFFGVSGFSRWRLLMLCDRKLSRQVCAHVASEKDAPLLSEGAEGVSEKR